MTERGVWFAKGYGRERVERIRSNGGIRTDNQRKGRVAKLFIR